MREWLWGTFRSRRHRRAIGPGRDSEYREAAVECGRRSQARFALPRRGRIGHGCHVIDGPGSREEGRSQALKPSPARATEYVAGDQARQGDFVAASEKTLHDVARSALLEADFFGDRVDSVRRGRGGIPPMSDRSWHEIWMEQDHHRNSFEERGRGVNGHLRSAGNGLPRATAVGERCRGGKPRQFGDSLLVAAGTVRAYGWGPNDLDTQVFRTRAGRRQPAASWVHTRDSSRSPKRERLPVADGKRQDRV